MERWDETEIEV